MPFFFQLPAGSASLEGFFPAPPALLLCFPAAPGDKTPGPSISPRHCGAWDLGTAPGNAAVAGERHPPARPAGAEPSPAAPAASLELPNIPPRSWGAARMSPPAPTRQPWGTERGPSPTVTPTSPGEAPAGRGPQRHPWEPRTGAAGPRRDTTDRSRAGDPPKPPPVSPCVSTARPPPQPPGGLQGDLGGTAKLLPLPAPGLAAILLLLLAGSRRQRQEPRPSASFPAPCPALLAGRRQEGSAAHPSCWRSWGYAHLNHLYLYFLLRWL